MLLPMAIPRTAFSPSAIEPASALTSPSLITSKGTPPHAVPQLEEQPPHALFEQLGRHGTVERPHAHLVGHVHSRRAAADGVHPRQLAAARRSESWMPSKWYCGSACALGFQGVSSLKTTSPSATAAHLRSLAPRSKPMRNPSRCPPSGEALSRSAGTASNAAPAISIGRPYTRSPINGVVESALARRRVHLPRDTPRCAHPRRW